MKKALLALAIAALAQSAFANVAGGPHDLSADGPASNHTKYGTLATGYAGLTACNFCHAVHKANVAFTGAPLWNRPDFTPAASWQMYPSGSLTGTPAVAASPAAASLTCLTCHEGSAAIGALYSTNGANVLTGGTNTYMDAVASRALVTGNDLRNDHPVSFTYQGATIGYPPITTGTGGSNVDGLPLYGAGGDQMECATCHDPHADIATQPRFLRPFPVAAGSFCAVCHTDK